MNATSFKPGLYQHWSGGHYIAIMLAADTREPCVVYASVSHAGENRGMPCSVRPFASAVAGVESWTDIVTKEGAFVMTQHEREEMLAGRAEGARLGIAGLVQRFTYIGAPQ